MSVCSSDNISSISFRQSQKRRQPFGKGFFFGLWPQTARRHRVLLYKTRERFVYFYSFYLGTLKSGGFLFFFFLFFPLSMFDEMGGGNAQQHSTEAQHRSTAQHSDWRDEIRKRERNWKGQTGALFLSRVLMVNLGRTAGLSWPLHVACTEYTISRVDIFWVTVCCIMSSIGSVLLVAAAGEAAGEATRYWSRLEWPE